MGPSIGSRCKIRNPSLHHQGLLELITMPPRPPSKKRIEFTKEVFRELFDRDEGLSQRDLAEVLGLDQSQVSVAVNSGRLGPKSLRKAAKAAGYSDAHIDGILREDGDSDREAIEREVVAAPLDLVERVRRIAGEGHKAAVADLAVLALTRWAGDEDIRRPATKGRPHDGVTDEMIDDLLVALVVLRTQLVEKIRANRAPTKQTSFF